MIYLQKSYVSRTCCTFSIWFVFISLTWIWLQQVNTLDSRSLRPKQECKSVRIFFDVNRCHLFMAVHCSIMGYVCFFEKLHNPFCKMFSLYQYIFSVRIFDVRIHFQRFRFPIHFNCVTSHRCRFVYKNELSVVLV